MDKKQEQILKHGSPTSKLKVLDDVLDAAQLPDLSAAEISARLLRFLDALALVKPERKLRPSFGMGGEKHYGYLYRLFLVQNYLARHDLQNALNDICTLLAEEREAFFQRRIIFAIIKTLQEFKEVLENEAVSPESCGRI